MSFHTPPPARLQYNSMFAGQLRHMCREPHCRSRLAAPVANEREAFCARGCHTRFYRSRCLACEQPKPGNKQLCGRRKCATELRALQRHQRLGRYHAPSTVEPIQKTPGFIGSEQPLGSGRAWRQIAAGPQLDLPALRSCLQLDRETAARADRANRMFWRDADAKAEETTLIRRHDSPINLIGGHSFAGTPTVDLGPSAPPIALPAPSNGDPLTIPDFLVRTAAPPARPFVRTPGPYIPASVRTNAPEAGA